MIIFALNKKTFFMKKVILSIVGMLTISACYRDGGPEYNAEYFKSEVVGTWKE